MGERPHIEYIQAQVLPWQASAPGGARPGTDIRILSAETVVPENGACSMLIRYPSGWTLGETHTLPGDEEFLVLDGSLRIGDRTFGRRGYGFLPVGFPRAGMAAPDGAVVLTFFEGPQKRITTLAGRHNAARLVLADTETMPYDYGFEHKLAGSEIGIKRLREDPYTGERTWILTKGQDTRENLPKTGHLEHHPDCVEEMYLLDGELRWPQGPMRAGAYFWRPAGLLHGPGASLTGFRAFFRTRGGPFSTIYIDEIRPRPLDMPAYRPVLPDHLRAIAREDAGHTPY